VHTNGSQLVATVYSIIPASGIQITSTIGRVTPSQLNIWDLLQGSLSGATGTLSGQMFHNACNVSFAISFSGTGAVGVLTSASNTAVGTISGVNCSQLMATNSSPYVFTKIF
jgi:hypothetical protein